MIVVWRLFQLVFIGKLALNAFRLIGTYLCYYKFKKRPSNLGQYIELADRLFSAADTNLLVHESTWNQTFITEYPTFLPIETIGGISTLYFKKRLAFINSEFSNV